MALQLRRGLDAARTAITPAEGEILYATDTKKVWVGDGTTAGGITVGGLTASGVTAATYGDSTTVPVFAVDTYGRITSVTNTGISFPSAGFNQLTVGGTTLYASSYSGAFSLVAGSNVTLSNSGSAITINSTGGSSSGITWATNTTTGGSISGTTPTGYSTSGNRLIVVVVGSGLMSGSVSVSSGSASFSNTTGNTGIVIYSTTTGASPGSTYTVTFTAFSGYAMAYAYVTTGNSSNTVGSSISSTSATSIGLSNPASYTLNPRIIAVSTSSNLNLSTAASTASGGGPTWATGSGFVHPLSTNSLSAAVWVGTGSWTTTATPTVTANASSVFWYLAGIATT